MQGSLAQEEESQKGVNTKKQAVMCAERSAFFLKKLPMRGACSKEGFRRGKECFEIKLFSTFHPT